MNPITTYANEIYELKHEANILQAYLDRFLVNDYEKAKIKDRLDVIRIRVMELKTLPMQELIEERKAHYIELKSKIWDNEEI